jgi:predicted protein tyrosine phosphatase
MLFKVLSRERVGKYNVDKKHIVISFRDPDKEKADLPKTDLRIDTLYLCFDDADKGEYKLFNKDAAKDIWAFVNKHIAEIDMIIVNCEAGISRSSGCAAGLSKVLNNSDEEFFGHPMLCPNMLIYKMILNEGIKNKS